MTRNRTFRAKSLSSAGPPPPIVKRNASRLISLTDQLVYSLGNFLLTTLVARSSASAADFGRFAVILSAYLIVAGVNRGLTSDSFTVTMRRRPRPSSAWASAQGQVLWTSVGLGTCVAVVAVILAGTYETKAEQVAIAFALGLPFLLSQDTLRYVAISRRMPTTALISDLVSIAVFAGGAVVFNLGQGSSGPSTLVWLWVAGAIAGGAVSAGMLQTRPKPIRPWTWVTENRSTSVRFGVENLINLGSQQAITFVTGLAVGLSQTGGLRALQSAFLPPATLIQGILSAILPDTVTRVNNTPERMLATAARLSCILVSIQAAWMAFAIAIPNRIGMDLFGQSWVVGRPYLLLWGLAQTIFTLAFAPFIVVRAAGRSDLSFRSRLLVVTVEAIALTAASFVGTLEGVVVASLASTPAIAIIWWLTLLKASRAQSPNSPSVSL